MNESQRKTLVLDFDINAKLIAKSAFNSLFVQLIVRMKGIITMPIITYFLLPRELGAFNLVMVTSSLLIPFFSFNMIDGPAVFFSQERSTEKICGMYLTVVNFVILSTLICSLLFWVICARVNLAITPYLPWVIFLLWAGIFSQLSGFLFVIYQQTGLIVINSMQRDIGIALLSILFVALGFSYQGLILANIVVTAATAWFLCSMVNRKIPYTTYVDYSLAKQFLKVALPLLPVFFFTWVIQSSAYYFLGYYYGEGSVGQYGVVCGITGIVLSLSAALNFFWYPVSARLWAEDRKKYRDAFQLFFSAVTAGLLLIVVLFELNAQWIMALLARKPEYHGAFVIMGLISFAFSMQVLITLLTAPLYSNLNTRSIFIANLLGALLNSLLNILLIPEYGLLGAAISTAVSCLLVVMILGYQNYRRAAFRFLDARLGMIIPLFIFGWILSLHARQHYSLIELLVIDMLLLAIFAFLIHRFYLRAEEMQCIKTVVKAAKNKIKG